uniref:Uncharacterized protein n=1 Tax=Panagrellus redivivus TaxID=6233 RepID=A0A7E4VC53_PANRE
METATRSWSKLKGLSVFQQYRHYSFVWRGPGPWAGAPVKRGTPRSTLKCSLVIRFQSMRLTGADGSLSQF